MPRRNLDGRPAGILCLFFSYILGLRVATTLLLWAISNGYSTMLIQHALKTFSAPATQFACAPDHAAFTLRGEKRPQPGRLVLLYAAATIEPSTQVLFALETGPDSTVIVDTSTHVRAKPS